MERYWWEDLAPGCALLYRRDGRHPCIQHLDAVVRLTPEGWDVRGSRVGRLAIPPPKALPGVKRKVLRLLLEERREAETLARQEGDALLAMLDDGEEYDPYTF